MHQNHLELVEDDTGVPPATSEKVNTVLRLAEQGAALTSQLLSFARKQALVAHDIELSSFLSDFCSMLSRTLGSRISIEVTVEPGLGAVLADPSHLRNALLNLAINARDAMPSGGHLKFEASTHAPATSEPVGGDLEGLAVIRVTDTGTGIAPEHLSKVCEPFFSTKGLNGTGMGLSMVYRIIQLHGGEIEVQSTPGRGAAFRVLLPKSNER